LEALCSLANFAYLNPDYTLPNVVKNDAQSGRHIVFQAQGVGHPLIEEDQKVVNDFAMHNLGEIVLITGSNMSGKSTFLRTLGINLCLAYAGGPVNAQSFSTSLFRIFTTIKVSDSVTEGYSYFYAEVRRLKALLDELQRPNPYPLFFLIDEIFKGTNNRERLIGSRAYIRALAGKNCVGAISTHDLELVKLADELPAIINYHFREDVVNGEMVFEYKLQTGPSPTTNALKIMQMEGLPIE
ncbi:MAG TPA: MutS family DNA mismatch repair protein, partial [Ktedonobacteraceae bacterium]|nr:MutS family DNA mismatch repair protein [Ktedonobacteraceae bacterium]